MIGLLSPTDSSTTTQGAVATNIILMQGMHAPRTFQDDRGLLWERFHAKIFITIDSSTPDAGTGT